MINNNPLPDITHEEFISLVGPLLVPENYAYLNSPALATPPASSPQTPNTPSGSGAPRLSTSNTNGTVAARQPINSPAPVDWIHFEGRSVKTTLHNTVGLDGLARERKWRSHCVFSVDVGRRAHQGVEALIPHADVIFLNKHYARAHSPQYASSPRAFLLSLTSIAPPHSLLVAHWGSDGAAVLSVPTKEYIQSSGWVEPSVPPMPAPRRTGEADLQSVRTGSDFWAGAGNETESSSMFTADLLNLTPARRPNNASAEETPRPSQRHPNQTGHRSKTNGKRAAHRDDSSDSGTDSDGTEIAGRGGGGRHTFEAPRPKLPTASEVVDEVGAQDAFVAGMMWALSRRLLPGEPYTPSAIGSDATIAGVDTDQKGRWRLEECLRYVRLSSISGGLV